MSENFIFNFIQCISVVVASVTAIYGITSWRRETKWKRKYELAEEVLSLFYECKEKIAVIRHPASYVGEGKTRKRRENEKPEESEILDNAYVFFERYEKEKEPFLKLASLKFRFIAIFGKEATLPFDEIAKILSDIFFAANRLGNRYWKDQGRKNFSEEQFDRHLQEMEKYEDIVWNSFENDKIELKIDNCIAKIEKYCLSIIQK
ncbi:hypothetical protein [Flavobacterium mesophilum]|uniref:hypothetical protein n=1 Tax=Flavobacterium mesophilum TaxID=3143495 RepID=UPI0031E3D571